MKNWTFFSLLFLLTIASNVTFAQSSPKHPGILLYEQGRFAEAVISLDSAASRSSNDSLLWNYLGLAQIETGEIKKAIKSLQKAISIDPEKPAFRVNLGYAYMRNQQTNKAQGELAKALAKTPNNVQALYLRGTSYLWEKKPGLAKNDADKIISIDPKFMDAYILKSEALMASAFGPVVDLDKEPELRASLESSLVVLTEGLAVCGNCEKRSNILNEIDGKRAFLDYYENRAKKSPSQAAPVNEPGTTPLKIISKPKAPYTDGARQKNVSGFVQLAILFGASGNVEYIMVLKRLDSGLDKNAINAARKIKFEPATKDGKPISVVRVFQYSFSLY